jgi:hypothetical protein
MYQCCRVRSGGASPYVRDLSNRKGLEAEMCRLITDQRLLEPRLMVDDNASMMYTPHDEAPASANERGSIAVEGLTMTRSHLTGAS